MTLSSDPLPVDQSSDRQLLQAFTNGLSLIGGRKPRHIDLYADVPPFYDAHVFRELWQPKSETDDHDPRHYATVQYMQRHCGYLRETEVLVIAAPVWNFSVPAVLKAWIDLVIAPGQVYRFGPDGIEPVHKIQRLLLLLSSGGPRDKVNAEDHYLSVVTAPFRYIKIPQIDVIWADGQEPSLYDDHEARLKKAALQAEDYARKLSDGTPHNAKTNSIRQD